MKNFDLTSYSVQEMDAKEIEKVDGGIFGIDDLIIGCAVAAFAAIVNDWDNFERGLTGRSYKR